MRILAVDDDPFIIEILELALLSLGYESVEVAQCAAEALDKADISTLPYDCILLDIQMPETDGIELCAMLRKMPEYRKIPIIMLTAMSDRNYIDRAFAAGATDYITKPFEAIELKSRLALAERLNVEIRNSSAAKSRLDEMADELVHQPFVSLGESFDIDDIPGYMNFNSFQNYLQQLDHGKFFLGEMMAMKIVGIDEIFERCGDKRYVEYISDVAEAVSDNLYGEACVLTYAGYGQFIIANSSGGQTLSDELYSLVQLSVEQMGLVYPDGQAIPTALVQSSVKKPVLFGSSGNHRVITTLISETEDMAAIGVHDQAHDIEATPGVTKMGFVS